ncbi:hypothetical protein V7S43_004064 [Phytophthora oleae]|uniref:RxLR effector protein n=1 Tax=Phytophthora oleae TaxID=2107226 RepID=A0ABD3FXU1_9STRA
MRLTYIVLVAAASIFACCDGASAISDSKRLAVPQSHVQTENNNNRFLRVHQEVADDEGEEKDEERAGPQLTKSFSEKFFTTAAAKLTRSKSMSELSKLDDAAYAKALDGNNNALYQRIENMGFDPDGMFVKMKQLSGESGIIDHQYRTLLDHYMIYWMAKYPRWTSTP